MRFPLSWLRDWVELPASLDLVSELLIKVGVGLEAVEDPSVHMDKVVVARVVKRDAHPDADKLSLCQVFDGSQNLQIVCGAKNFKEGDLVPLAKEGALLPGGFKIKRSKIRGVESFGMLCSSEELGLGKGEEGLMLLKAGLKEGSPLAEALGLDPIFDVETTANRPDHLSVRGLAREIAALTGKPLKGPAWELKEEGAAAEASFKALVEDPGACPLYMARLVEGVTIAPSPDWVRRRLEGAGIRPINNVVDATNYILIEYGQPLHAFDADKLSGGLIQARQARPGETIRTLDSADRALEPGDLVIADASKAVALAGVMGGLKSEVTAATKRILLEAAVFKPLQVRRTGRRLGLRSESSLRFERGVDAASTAEALDRAAALMADWAGGKAAKGRLSAGPGRPKPQPVQADASRINALLGLSHAPEAMARLLSRRDFAVQQQGQMLSVTPPSWRADVQLEADVAEELAHLAGLDSIPSTHLPEVRTPDPDAAEWLNSWILRRGLSGLGLSEASTLSYLDPALASAWGYGQAVRIDNPLSDELSLLRPSLLPNLAACVAENLRRKAPGAGLFELGRCFAKEGESMRLAVVLAGRALEGNWALKDRDWDFYDLRAVLEGLGSGLGYPLRLAADAKAPGWLHPGQSGKVNMGPLSGWAGALHPALAPALGLRQELFVLELQGWSEQPLAKARRFQAYSQLPHVERDLSCLVEEAFEAGRLMEAIRKEGFAPASLRLKDVYRGAPLPEGKKSLTVALTYLPGEATLTDDEVNSRHGQLVAKLKASLPLEIRD